ncbi:hypothetical protein [Paenibacillus borealis]|uniref:Uncharacterized protein n=1 Tax=Paenibacillus borealis TaxID=160799 RepID=A0A089MTD0_PAEBO|nr:hypothetical protein [Paenibacillus borealis]AIQ59714.1 hypothetical protein PBOR_24235 [Paenibacillus borealis]
MSGAWNYWHVYHFMVTYYQNTGLVPERSVLLAEFPSLDPEQVDEGIAEFNLVMGKRGEAG